MKFSLITVVVLAVVASGSRIHDVVNEISINPLSQGLDAVTQNPIENVETPDWAGMKDLPKNVLERTAEYWTDMAQRDIIERINRVRNTNKAKNIILFIGDGMSIATLMAARTYKGQLENKSGEEQHLSFEKFPYVGLSKTYCANRQVADSACSATAYLCGVKANMFTIGVNGQVRMNNCEDSQNPENHVESLAKWAFDAGKGTGIVTTTTVTHASPSGAYAHVANRMWESDADVAKENITNCDDIAKQLITKVPGRDFSVILGGGRKKFRPAGGVDPDGERLDGADLVQTWQSNNPAGQFVTSKQQLINLNYRTTKKLLGLFKPSHFDFHLNADNEQPSLADMTEAAIKVLSQERRGFFLFVEGGLIDHGHHLTKARYALDETVEFSKAIQRARELTSDDETLIVVSSDHSHTMSISGYPLRGNDILGLGNMESDVDGQLYTTLSYANGPQTYLDAHGNRLNLTGSITTDFEYPANVPVKLETHAGDDVGVFASGPHAHMFSGVYDQHFIPHLMAYAACVGSGKTACD